MYYITYASFSGGYYKEFYWKRTALKIFEQTKHTCYRVTLVKNKFTIKQKIIADQVNENLRPERYK